MSAKNYKVGDEVRIKSDLIVDKGYGFGVFFDYNMQEYIGKKAKVINIEGGYKYKLNIDNGRWAWTDEMLEPVENIEQPKYVKCIDNKDAEIELEIGKIYKIKRIHKRLYAFVNENDGYELEGFTYSFYSSRFEIVSPASNPQPQSTKSIIKIRQVGDTTYATYNTHGKGQATRNPNLDEYNKEYGILLATARALGLDKDKVDKIIDVLFDEGKEEVVTTPSIEKKVGELKVGDRIVGIGDTKVGYSCNKPIKGLKGKVLESKGSFYIGIEFDEDINGHTLEGNCKDKHGWYVDKDEVKLIPQTTESLQQENKELREELNNIKDKIKSLLD